ncbi:hypothetical protein [Micromonospora sp. CPCC 206061]|uniref:hypothetical protein n=1 Tax=Micromonospora sp. CPCC 206061 TaxID=3122410 RepID=UPI002FF229C0
MSLVTDPVTGVDERDAVASGPLGSVVRSARLATAALRPSAAGGHATTVDAVALTRVAEPITAPLDGVLEPVTGVLRTAAAPAVSTLGSVGRTTSDVVAPQVDRWLPGGTTGGGPGSGSVVAPVDPNLAAGQPEPVPAAAAAGAGSESANRPYAGADDRVAGTPEARQGGESRPDRPRPAPLRGLFGAGAGMPVSGPAPHMEGGASAVVPSPVVESTVAIHRLPVTTDVVVLRRDAEAPTVSPD